MTVIHENRRNKCVFMEIEILYKKSYLADIFIL